MVEALSGFSKKRVFITRLFPRCSQIRRSVCLCPDRIREIIGY